MFYEILFVCVILGQKSYFVFQIRLIGLLLVFYLIRRFVTDFVRNFISLIVGWLSMNMDELCDNILATVFCRKKEPLQGTYYEGTFAYGNHLALLLQSLCLEINLFQKYL